MAFKLPPSSVLFAKTGPKTVSSLQIAAILSAWHEIRSAASQAHFATN
jgi:hypothetical protein